MIEIGCSMYMYTTVQRFFSTHWYRYLYPFNWEKWRQNQMIFYQCTCNDKLISKEEKVRTRQDALISLW